VKFLQDNILLIAVAFVSGAMLLWPYVRRATGGPSVSPSQATQLINREDALVIDVREPGEFGAGHILARRLGRCRSCWQAQGPPGDPLLRQR